MISFNLQKYIHEIEQSDVLQILELKKENFSYIKQHKRYNFLFR
jgi:hypothetical protein